MKEFEVDGEGSADGLVSVLRVGGLAIAPTETVYGLLARADDPAAVRRVRDVKGQRTSPFARLVPSLEAVVAAGASLPLRAQRLARRYWPGPLTLVLDCGEETVGFRVPGHEFTRRVVELADFPVLATSANRSGDPPPTTYEEAVNQIGADVSVAVRDGPTPLGEASTVVQIRASGATVLLREGILSWGEVESTMNRNVLFVCTGNTCRSPMAEAMFRGMLAEHLGCSLDEVHERGWTVGSAGVGAAEGERAATNAQVVMRERGFDIGGHRSRYASPEVVGEADVVVALSGSHLRALEGSSPGSAGNLRLLDPSGVPDPIGGSLEVYRRCADHIHGRLSELLQDVVASED